MSGTSNEALYGGETTVRGYMAQGEFVLAIGVLVQHYQDAIVSYCQCHLLDQEVAREVAQEIFLAAFESIPGFCGYSSIKTWLYGIAFKKCLEVERNRKRREALVRDHQETIGARVHCDPLGQSVARLGCQDTATPPQVATPRHRNGRVVWSGARDESRLGGGSDGSSGSHHSNGAGVAYCLPCPVIQVGPPRRPCTSTITDGPGEPRPRRLRHYRPEKSWSAYCLYLLLSHISQGRRSIIPPAIGIRIERDTRVARLARPHATTKGQRQVSRRQADGGRCSLPDRPS